MAVGIDTAGAVARLGDAAIKVWKSEIASTPPAQQAGAGQILQVNDAGVLVACGEGALLLTELQRAGGKRLAAREFLRGFQISAGQCFALAPAHQ